MKLTLGIEFGSIGDHDLIEQTQMIDLSDDKYQEFKQYLIDNFWDEDDRDFNNDNSDYDLLGDIETFFYDLFETNEEMRSQHEKYDGEDFDLSIMIKSDDMEIFHSSLIKGGYTNIYVKGYNL